MSGILSGLRVVEGSAFVAAPLGGMTLAQLGADIIRFDQIGGGLDYHRWPLAADGQSLFWAGLNKGKRSIQIDVRTPEGRELVAALIAAPGEQGGRNGEEEIAQIEGGLHQAGLPICKCKRLAELGDQDVV